jgi:penicillin-binding protein 2
MNVYEDLRPLRSRLAWWRALVVVLFAGLVLRFWQLQIVRSTAYDELARANHVRPIPESAPRGLILDRYGSIIAENRPSFNLTLEEERPDTLESLKELVPLGYAHEDVERYLREARLDAAILKEDIPLEEVARVEARQLELPGAHIQFVPRRYYPSGTRAAHLVGYVGRMSEDQIEYEEFTGASRNDYVGQSGVERIYNQLLMGRNGVQRVVVNSLGRRERVLDQVPPVGGESVQLSIDLELQRVAEEAFSGHAGSLVALDPRTGEILAMGSFPAYDPNFFSGRFEKEKWLDLVNDAEHPLTNRAIQGRYAPGSTFKLVVAAAALEEGVATPDTEMSCSGSVRMYGNVFHCARAGGHGRIDMVDAIAQSCNSYFFQLGAKLQIETIARYGRLFGLGAPTGVDLPHEVSGLIPDPEWKKSVRNEPWYAGETISVAVGQGSVLVTSLQMARLAATVGTSGDIHRPKLFLRTLPVGALPEPYVEEGMHEPVRHVNLRESTWRALQEGMFRAVNLQGTGGRARLDGVQVAGKTGTAQVASRQRISAAADEHRPEHLRNHAWFVGFAPRVNPEIAIAVLVEHGGGGGAAAAPVAQKVFQAYFDRQREERVRNGPRQTTMALH